MAYAVPYIIYAAIAIATIAASYYMTTRVDVKGQKMKPATLDSFTITYCEEGTVVPLIYGTVRVPGNILWYGNLGVDVSHAHGPGRPIDGYFYSLDVWQGIGQGLLEIIGLYSGDKLATATNSYDYDPVVGGMSGGISRTFTTQEGLSQTVIYNPGDSNYYPSEPGSSGAILHPICHAFMPQWDMPKNQTYLPTIHWVVKHRWPANFPLNNAELYNGDNAAAIIYDLLVKSGETSFNISTFQYAANYWAQLGYGLNLSFSEQLDALELIQQIFNYVDGCLIQNADGEWELYAYSASDTADDEISTDDFLDFSLSRNSWDSVPNFFIANYTDALADYSRRTVRFPNSALIAMLGYRLTKTIDLTAFNNSSSASRRMWEIGKQYSFPKLTAQFKTDLRFHEWRIGMVVSLTHSEYGISGADFRITSKTMEDLDKNEITFEAEQMMSSLLDGSFQIGGETEQETPDFSPDPLPYQAAFELPYILAYGNYPPAYLLLGARSGSDTLFNVYISYDGGVGYSFVKSATLWSLHGTLNHDYDSSHTSQSDPTAIDLVFYREDPVFETLTDAEFPYTDRYALIGNEILRFKTVSPGSGDNDLLLTTIERGCFNTPIEDHYQDDSIWLFELGDGMVLEGITAPSFHLKFVPVTGGSSADISECVAIAVTSTGKASGHSESPSLSPSASTSA